MSASVTGGCILKIVILEDDIQQANMVTVWLEADGHYVSHFVNGEDLLRFSEPFDIAILDWELPDKSGIEVLAKLRKSENMAPVIFATQRDSEEDIVNALKSGADDYLIKPLRKPELLARLEALARRAGIGEMNDILSLGDIKIDVNQKKIFKNGDVVKATLKDFEMAVIFIRNIGKILSREFLLKTIWGVDADINTRTVDMHVSRVRRGLGINPDMGFCISNVYQHGYRLEKVIPEK